MVAIITEDVLTGNDARLFVSRVDVSYTNIDFKNIIFNSDNLNKFLLLRKKIGSKIIIDDVKVVDDDLIDSMLSPTGDI